MKTWAPILVLFVSACAGANTAPATPALLHSQPIEPQVVQSYGAHLWVGLPDNRATGQMAADSVGNVWYIATTGVDEMNYSGTVTRYPFAWPQNATTAGIAIGNDRNAWVATTGSLVRVTPSGAITTYQTSSTSPGFITAGFGGDLWFVDQSLHHYVYSTGALTNYAIASHEPGLGITRGPDGNIWFITTNTVERVNTAGAMKSFAIPNVGETAYNNGVGIVSGPNGHLFTMRDDCTSYEVATSGTVVGTHNLAVSAYTCGPQLMSTGTAIVTMAAAPVPGGCEAGDVHYEIASYGSGVPGGVPPNYVFGQECTWQAGFPGETVGSDGNLYFNMGGIIGVEILDSITVTPHSFAFTAPSKYTTLTVGETNYSGSWTASATEPTVVRVVKWLTKNKIEIESVGKGRARIIIRDTKHNYYNVVVSVS